MTTEPTKREEWEEEFDAHFSPYFKSLILKDGLRVFIQHTLSRQRAEDLYAVEGEMNEIRKNPTEDQEDGAEFDEGFDSAIEEGLSIIRSVLIPHPTNHE